MHQCPVEGCEVEFSKRDSVAAHVQGSGGIHKGYSKSQADEALLAGSTLEPSTESEEAEESEEQPPEPVESGTESNDPTTDGGPPSYEEATSMLEAPCGCDVDESTLEDGKTYRCSEHNKRFTYHA